VPLSSSALLKSFIFPHRHLSSTTWPFAPNTANPQKQMVLSLVPFADANVLLPDCDAWLVGRDRKQVNDRAVVEVALLAYTVPVLAPCRRPGVIHLVCDSTMRQDFLCSMHVVNWSHMGRRRILHKRMHPALWF
jgi:hypothetical protein